MEDSRRDFLKKAGVSIVGLGAAGTIGTAFAQAIRDLQTEKLPGALAGRRWAMVIDTARCAEHQGCTACIDACHLVHNVPHFDDPRREVKWLWKEAHEHSFPTQVHDHTPDKLRKRPTLVLCNHCAEAPCVRVCPTRATWKRASDGIVMMDMHRCIGCRYCVVACPYGSRSFNWVDPRPQIKDVQLDFPTRTKGVVEKCNFCADRLARGQIPACVEASQMKGCRALFFGDLKDPGSEVARIVAERHTIQRKPMLGTQPYVFYIV